MGTCSNTIMDGTLVARQVPSSSSASNSGSHRGGSNSLSSIIWTICAALLVAGVLIGGFFFLRSRMKRLYAPRKFHEALDENEKTPAASGKTGWLQRFKELDDSYVLSHGSPDGYPYLRFFRMLTIICFVGCCITWPILFPVNATGGGGEQQLDLLSFSNVANPVRYYAHTFVAWIFLDFIMFLITRETMHFIKVRQAYLLSMWNASRLSARVVLFTSVPGDVVASEEPLREMFRGVRTVWIPTDCERLQEMVDDRDDAFDKLEKAEVQLSAKAIKRRRKDKNGNGDSEQGTNPWMLQKDRPTHRLKPVIGSKVDTIDWARQHLSELLPQIKKEQELHRSGKKPRRSADWCYAWGDHLEKHGNEQRAGFDSHGRRDSHHHLIDYVLGYPDRIRRCCDQHQLPYAECAVPWVDRQHSKLGAGCRHWLVPNDLPRPAHGARSNHLPISCQARWSCHAFPS